MARDADRQRRSFPHPPTDLENLADVCGMGGDELRALLRREIAERTETNLRTRAKVVEPAAEEVDWNTLRGYYAETIALFAELLAEQDAAAVAALS